MVENKALKNEYVKQPQPEPVEVDCGTSSAIHELDLEGEAEQVPKDAVSEKLPPKEREDKTKP